MQLCCLFHFIGEPLLNVFGVDISSFAIAGSVILFLMGLEMVMGLTLFKHEGASGGSIVPIAFPLIAGAGSITTLLSLRAEYQSINILIALSLNMIIVYLVLRLTSFFERILGPSGLHIVKKFFGIILLAIAIKLFMSNLGIEVPNNIVNEDITPYTYTFQSLWDVINNDLSYLSICNETPDSHLCYFLFFRLF